MKLSECKIGEVVQHIHDKKIGHIIGITKNSCGEVIPIVYFAGYMTGDKYECHHNNLQKLED